VVLLILAGITITYVMGDNSIFKKAQEAKLKTDIVNWKETRSKTKNRYCKLEGKIRNG